MPTVPAKPKAFNYEVEVINNEKEFKWRIVRSDGRSTAWTQHYQGLLRMDNACYASAYWEGVLPVEKIFSIVE